jgi:hypothetical protein
MESPSVQQKIQVEMISTWPMTIGDRSCMLFQRSHFGKLPLTPWPHKRLPFTSVLARIAVLGTLILPCHQHFLTFRCTVEGRFLYQCGVVICSRVLSYRLNTGYFLFDGPQVAQLLQTEPIRLGRGKGTR